MEKVCLCLRSQIVSLCAVSKKRSLHSHCEAGAGDKNGNAAKS